MEETLRRREAELREAQRLAHVGNWELDLVTGAVVWSEELYRIFGLDPRRPAPRYEEHLRILTPSSLVQLKSAIENTRKTGNPYEVDLELVRPDGCRRWIAARGEVKRSERGEITGLRGTAADITDHRRIEEELRRSKNELQRSQRLAHIGSWNLDIPANRLAWGEETYRIFKIPPRTPMTYERFRSAIHPGDRDLVDLAWSAALEGRPYDIDHRIIADGETRWVRERAEVDFDQEGRAVRGEGVVQDITEQKGMEEEIRRLNTDLEQEVVRRTAQLEAAYRELESYAYSAAHDLRAPLRGLDGFSQALLEDYPDRLDDRGKDYLRRIRAGAQRLGRLIDDLSKLLKVARSRIVPEEVDLSALARERVDKLQLSAPKRKVSFHIEEGMVVRGDSRLLRELIGNLLDNAWKFTGHTKEASIEFGKDGNGDSTYFVRDNGAGFDMAYAGKLFSPFQRLHNETYTGTGIGLAIIKRIAEHHGGRVWAEAEPGRGATFFFTLQPDAPEEKH